MNVKAADPEQRFVELLKSHPWNIAVKILKEGKRVSALEAGGRDSVGSHRGDRRRA
ncbi:hypothetical protein ES705_22541 [subsurface metagenome]